MSPKTTTTKTSALWQLLMKLRGNRSIKSLRALHKLQCRTHYVSHALGPFYISPGELADALKELAHLTATTTRKDPA